MIAAGTAHEQGGDVSLFKREFGGEAGEIVVDPALLQLQFAGDAIQLMQFEPHLLRCRAVQLRRTQQLTLECMGRPLQGRADQYRAILAVLRRNPQHDLFVADGQMALQRLAQIADLA
ncbi:hypothetical protein D3C81_1004990 [compost metagenome]